MAKILKFKDLLSSRPTLGRDETMAYYLLLIPEKDREGHREPETAGLPRKALEGACGLME